MYPISALAKLVIILEKLESYEHKESSAGVVVLEVMNLNSGRENLVDFFALIKNAEEEIKQMNDISYYEKHNELIIDLKLKMSGLNFWMEKSHILSDYIKNKHIISAMASLADEFHRRRPQPSLPQDFLKIISNKLSSLLSEVKSSDLSEDLKKIIIRGIEDIIAAINKSDIEGIEKIGKNTKSLVVDLNLTGSYCKESNKKNPAYNKINIVLCLILYFFKPTNVYDIVGIIPLIDPKIKSEIEKIFNKKDIQEKDINKLIENKREIQGKEIKAISSSEMNDTKPPNETNITRLKGNMHE
ncbi:MAG: hypothetical protein F6J89_24645 [Symploca sp. SIO1C4]|uniref:Uncharacterized protein n=1 Tax=Symploca sp. SIO1C4 TaxID=2607765 RepID=A0A6B3NIJ6_9CYAN|nr:hypothetical protein [Symploca sp. SIO1C4]